MALLNELETSGSWLFRYRSYLPVGAVFIFLAALKTLDPRGLAEGVHDYRGFACMFVSFLGLAVRVFTIGYAPAGTSGRNTRRQIAKVLNTTGMYSIVRHPLYFGNFLIVLGLSFFFQAWWMVLLAASMYALYYERIMFAEEAYLRKSFGDAFERWAAVTPAIIPRIRKWEAPPLPFCVRTALRREYTGFFGIVAVFSFLEFAARYLAAGTLGLQRLWTILLGLAALVYIVLRTLKKYTKLLHVEGR